MRISEKTIEVNFCSQLSNRLKQSIFWFGLTQKQEARAGFDICSKIKGKILIFQFKASNKVLSNGRRRFTLPHKQLVNLQRQQKNHIHSVYYVFPLFGETGEILKDYDVVGRSRMLSVKDLPDKFPLPTKKDGFPRKNKSHYGDVNSSTIIIHSEPKEFKVEQSFQLIETELSNPDWQIKSNLGGYMERDFEYFWELARNFKKNAVGGIVRPDGRFFEL